MSLVLALETTGNFSSIALSFNGLILSSRDFKGNMHSSLLLKEIEEILFSNQFSLSDLTSIVLGNGPGLFTGIRVGVGVAQGLSFGLDIPCQSHSSLLSVVETSFDNATNGDLFFVVIDAKMQQVYWQAFKKESDGIIALNGALLDNPEDACKQIFNLSSSTCCNYVLGDGVELLDLDLEKLTSENCDINERVYPTAKGLLVMKDRIVNPDANKIIESNVLPNYVRNDVAHK